MGRILVVDDDPGIQAGFESLLASRGHDVILADSGETALELLAHEAPDLIVLDVFLPGIDGLQTFRGIKSTRPATPVIVMTGAGTMKLAIEASKLGAFDYQPKPFDPGHMLQLVENALESVRLARAAHGGDDPHRFPSEELLVGSSRGMQELFKAVGRVAPTDATVLIRGESGTGKELVAKTIHQHGPRHDQPFVTVNCAAIPETLLESELFGHERGSFTGALARRQGMFERAHGGTILLDEIGDVPAAVQVKILRVLQDRTFERIGGAETVRVDVRILAATNRDLERAIAEGRFREDLYHRLNVVTVRVPPLRERREDLPALVNTFLARFAAELKIPKPQISREALALLEAHAWPGNVRELEHCIQRALVFSHGFPLQRDDLQRALSSEAKPRGMGASGDTLREYVRAYLDAHSGPGCESGLVEALEKALLVEALNRCGGNQTRAAELLGIPRPTLHAKLRRHEIRITTSVIDPANGEPPPADVR